MKKKFLLAIMALAMICATVVCLVACNPTDTVDKSFQNAEFVSFRKKIVAILKDNGIFVNDIDAKQKTSSTASDAKLQLAGISKDGNAFDAVMAKPEYLANSDDYNFAREQVFGMSLKMSLCLGDGISNYFGEKEFFDIAVKIGDSYMSVSEKDNVNTVRAYSPGDFEDIFENIDLEFVSATDYTFTSLSLGNGSTMFASGNAQKQFIMVLIYGDNNGGEVVYSPNGTTFYSTTKDEALNACIDIIGNDAFEIDKSKFYGNKTNAKYTFTAEQNQALTDKYFKDIQSSIDHRQGIVSVTKGGITYADSYFECENNTVARIPEGTEYINMNFVIDDSCNTISALTIPRSLKGVVKTHDDKTGEELATPQIVSANELRIELYDNKDGHNKQKILESINVENGSPLFRSGSGHLRTADGIYVYLLDAPVDDYDMSLFSEYAAYMLLGYEELGYTQLCFSTTEIDFDFDGDTTVDFYSPLFKNLTSINISGTYDESNDKFGLTIGVFNDLTVNIDIADSFKFHGIPINFGFISNDNRNHSVTVNITALTVIDEVFADGTTVTVNVGTPEILFETGSITKPADNDNVRYIFAEPTLTDEQKENFIFSVCTLSDTVEITALCLFEQAVENLVMPNEFVFAVTALEISKGCTQNTVIKLNDNIKYIINDEGVAHSVIPTFIYNGTLDEFESNVQIIDEYGVYFFNVTDCDGHTKMYAGNNATVPYTLTFNVFGETFTKYANANTALLLQTSDFELDSDNYVYFLINDFGSAEYVNPNDTAMFLYPEQDAVYTLVRYALGEDDNGMYRSTQYVDYTGITLEVNIMFDIRNNYVNHTYVDIFGEGNGIYISASWNSLFDVYPLSIQVSDEIQTKNMRLVWSWDEDYNLILSDIVEYISQEEPKK